MTRIKAHADDSNIVCAFLHNDKDRLHVFIEKADAGMPKRRLILFQ